MVSQCKGSAVGVSMGWVGHGQRQEVGVLRMAGGGPARGAWGTRLPCSDMEDTAAGFVWRVWWQSNGPPATSVS